jgi:hypothetical protein
MDRLIAACDSITQSWNQHCGVVSKVDPDRYEDLKKKIMDVNPTLLHHRKFPQAVIGKVDTGWSQLILADGNYTCSCPKYKHTPYDINRRFPCKHLFVIAAHALYYFVRNKE